MFIPLHPKAQDIDFAALDRSGWCLPLPGSQYGRACTDFVVGSAPLTETMPSNHLSLQPFFDLPDSVCVFSWAVVALVSLVCVQGVTGGLEEGVSFLLNSACLRIWQLAI